MRRFLNRELKWKLIENSFASIWIFREIFDFSLWERKLGCEFWRKWIFEYFCGVLIKITGEFEGNWTCSNALKIVESSEKRAKIIFKKFPQKSSAIKQFFTKRFFHISVNPTRIIQKSLLTCQPKSKNSDFRLSSCHHKSHRLKLSMIYYTKRVKKMGGRRKMIFPQFPHEKLG